MNCDFEESVRNSGDIDSREFISRKLEMSASIIQEETEVVYCDLGIIIIQLIVEAISVNKIIQ